MALISESLRTNTNIRDLDLSGNGIALGGSTELALALKSMTSSFDTRRSRSHISYYDVIIVNQYLTKLNLGGNELKSEGVLRIAAALRENKNVSSLQVHRKKREIRRKKNLIIL